MWILFIAKNFMLLRIKYKTFMLHNAMFCTYVLFILIAVTFVVICFFVLLLFFVLVCDNVLNRKLVFISFFTTYFFVKFMTLCAMWRQKKNLNSQALSLHVHTHTHTYMWLAQCTFKCYFIEWNDSKLTALNSWQLFYDWLQ